MISRLCPCKYAAANNTILKTLNGTTEKKEFFSEIVFQGSGNFCKKGIIADY